MVISKAIRDAPWARANSKPLNSKENGGLILHSTKLNTGVLQLSSEMRFYYHSAAIFLHQSLFANGIWQHSTVLTTAHESDLLWQRSIRVYVFICSLWSPPLFHIVRPEDLIQFAILHMLWHITSKETNWVCHSEQSVWQAAGATVTSGNISWPHRQKEIRKFGQFGPKPYGSLLWD